MSISSISPEEAAATARELLNGRVTLVEELAAASRRLASAQQTLEQAEKDYSKAWSEAEKNGWTVAELRKVGLAEPSRRRAGRPRKTAADKSTPRNEV